MVLGRGEATELELIVVALLLMGATYWSLCDWAAQAASQDAARKRLAAMRLPLRAQTQDTLDHAGKLAAIKLLHAELDLGLREAKDVVEAMQNSRSARIYP